MTAVDIAWQANFSPDENEPDMPPEDYEAPPEDGFEEEASAFERLVDALDAELLDTDGLSKIPRLDPLVDGFLYRNTTARVYGASGTFKSFVLLDIAAHIGAGLPWRGHKVKQGIVINLVAEGAGGYEKRVRAWEQHHGRRMENVLILPRPVQANSREWLVLTEVCRRRGAVLIICDTQARITVGVEENSAKEMGVIVDRVEAMRAATGACVVLVHHEGVQGERGRGSTAVKGALQTELRVSRKGKHLEETRITVISDKQKDDEEAHDVVFGLEQQVIEGICKEDGSPITSVVLVPADPLTSEQDTHGLTPSAQKILGALRGLAEPISRKEIGDRIKAANGSAPTRETMSRELAVLLERHLVDRFDRGAGKPDLWQLAGFEPVTMEETS